MPDIVPTQGTVLGEALKMCYASFNTKEKKYKSVILISDGEDHDEEATKVASQMAAEGVIDKYSRYNLQKAPKLLMLLPMSLKR